MSFSNVATSSNSAYPFSTDPGSNTGYDGTQSTPVQYPEWDFKLELADIPCEVRGSRQSATHSFQYLTNLPKEAWTLFKDETFSSLWGIPVQKIEKIRHAVLCLETIQYNDANALLSQTDEKFDVELNHGTLANEHPQSMEEPSGDDLGPQSNSNDSIEHAFSAHQAVQPSTIDDCPNSFAEDSMSGNGSRLNPNAPEFALGGPPTTNSVNTPINPHFRFNPNASDFVYNPTTPDELTSSTSTQESSIEADNTAFNTPAESFLDLRPITARASPKNGTANPPQNTNTFRTNPRASLAFRSATPLPSRYSRMRYQPPSKEPGTFTATSGNGLSQKPFAKKAASTKSYLTSGYLPSASNKEQRKANRLRTESAPIHGKLELGALGNLMKILPTHSPTPNITVQPSKEKDMTREVWEQRKKIADANIEVISKQTAEQTNESIKKLVSQKDFGTALQFAEYVLRGKNPPLLTYLLKAEILEKIALNSNTNLKIALTVLDELILKIENSRIKTSDLSKKKTLLEACYMHARICYRLFDCAGFEKDAAKIEELNPNPKYPNKEYYQLCVRFYFEQSLDDQADLYINKLQSLSSSDIPELVYQNATNYITGYKTEANLLHSDFRSLNAADNISVQLNWFIRKLCGNTEKLPANLQSEALETHLGIWTLALDLINRGASFMGCFDNIKNSGGNLNLSLKALMKFLEKNNRHTEAKLVGSMISI